MIDNLNTMVQERETNDGLPDSYRPLRSFLSAAGLRFGYAHL